MAACGSSCSLDILMQVEDILESRPASRNILFLPVFYVILDPSRTPTPQELFSTGYGNSCSLRITIAADRVRHRNPVDICGAYSVAPHMGIDLFHRPTPRTFSL
jgi:hypothetical protein